jgi:cell division protein FtsA
VLNSLEIGKRNHKAEQAEEEIGEQPANSVEAAQEEFEEEDLSASVRQQKRTFFEKWAEKFKDFLDKAE